MLALLAPSKTLADEPTCAGLTCSSPALLTHSKELIGVLQSYSPKKLETLMSVSKKLADLNAQRFSDFSTPFRPSNSAPAIRSFKGDVYQDIEVEEYTKADFTFANQHLRILSGLYGLLRPLDLMQPYRLEMKTKLKTKRGKDLYEFWGTKITEAVDKALSAQKDRILINLASQEYFKAIHTDRLDAEIITPIFKEIKGGQAKVIPLFAKRARGAMANFIVRKRTKSVKGLKKFTAGGYRFASSESNDSELVFLRG